LGRCVHGGDFHQALRAWQALCPGRWEPGACFWSPSSARPSYGPWTRIRGYSYLGRLLTPNHATPPMKFGSLLLPCGALGAALAILLPASGQAFNVFGDSLDLTQRDFRVFNNFNDPEANDNVTPDPAFPGSLGAVRAIRAAVAEWGSELRKDGNSDPSQVGDLGSGGANFDSHFQGLSPDPGGTNDNVFSEVTGQSSGVLAYTELPIADGWRIRFFRAPTVWSDGPGPPSSPATDHKDLQGVACHEYGHALGLDHSTLAVELTMFPGSSTNFVGRRSLEADDIAGVQFIYGVKSPSKPHIENYILNGSQITLRGDHFDTNNNEVWFTRAAGLGDGTPLQVLGLASTQGGTEIQLSLPAGAGNGDVLVRVPGVTGDKLSNAYPFDTVLGDCPGVTPIGSAKVNSTFLTAELIASGTPSVSYNDFNFDVFFGGISNTPAILFYGSQPNSAPFFGGTLYAGGPLTRDQHAVMGSFGEVQFQVPVTPSMIGNTRYYQLWYQDPGDAFGVGLTGGVQVTFCP
jgi:hypothetical protein